MPTDTTPINTNRSQLSPSQADRGRPVERLAGPVREFLHLESAGGVLLLLATVASIVVANSPWSSSAADFWETELTVLSVWSLSLTESLKHWINDGLMAVFFFVVALEIKRELVTGELNDRRKAALPAVAAVGGTVVPSLIYLAINFTGQGSVGWGIPMATDIAFAIGVLALLGPRVSPSLKLFLLTLAIVDDMIAILVIALFYSGAISLAWLGAAGGMLFLILAMRALGIWFVPAYVAVGIGVWIAFLESGVHATMAGVILGLMTPAKPLSPDPTSIRLGTTTSWDTIRETLFEVRETLPVAERLQKLIHPWTAFIILPLFAFVNAGIPLSGAVLGEAATSPVSLGVIAGLVIGKPLGITTATWIAVKLGAGSLPNNSSWTSIAGVGTIAGIGFTVSLFVAGLAFDDAELENSAKAGVLAASVLAAAIGVGLLTSQGPYPNRPEEPGLGQSE